ncbi:MAG: PhnD/SsuA/transferrin family substrate-binding protein [Sulfurimonas sp.]|nr:PhnD/SsuA/transferrin family substrate-binding protein [Sulfurimonas sp.]
MNKKSLGGWQMAWKELVNNGIDISDFKSLEFQGTHDKVVYAVLNKEVDVGTVIAAFETLNSFAIVSMLWVSFICNTFFTAFSLNALLYFIVLILDKILYHKFRTTILTQGDYRE